MKKLLSWVAKKPASLALSHRGRRRRERRRRLRRRSRSTALALAVARRGSTLLPRLKRSRPKSQSRYPTPYAEVLIQDKHDRRRRPNYSVTTHYPPGSFPAGQNVHDCRILLLPLELNSSKPSSVALGRAAISIFDHHAMMMCNLFFTLLSETSEARQHRRHPL